MSAWPQGAANAWCNRQAWLLLAVEKVLLCSLPNTLASFDLRYGLSLGGAPSAPLFFDEAKFGNSVSDCGNV